MAERPQSPEELAAVLENITDLNFNLPDPEDEDISEPDFEHQVDNAWKVCDHFDLQTDIWRGRILSAVRDREKIGGEGRGRGFLNWLKDREISKSQAYSLIELANSADTLLRQGDLDPDTINKFSKRAFVETAKSAPEVQQMVTQAARDGDRITRREVRQLSDEWTAMTSELLPEEVKEKATAGSLPPRYLAPLVREMEKLPPSHQVSIREEAAINPDVDTVKQLTSDARSLSKYLDAAAQVQAIAASSIDVEMALEEALRMGCLNTAADLVKQASQIEQTVAKLYTTWRRLGSLTDRLYVDTGASTPHLRMLLTCLDRLAGQVIEVPLGDEGDRTIRLQILSDSQPQ
ncbi:hypothetical protein [Laspinema olomoucense]|uniref:DUF3102 domain-containing protein n=1 Tax=Laspinema olomoucense D3b TaxID=2953688 RepID=A0ABT2NGT2_9CYAN|nr:MULTISPECIES: hypothetical protein [unclassified Laspinema]MCT7973481.1 hypothetical protein [Laspinema sp. D3d]MCT7980466.1 hypothetical protein [Laspinema sp. D3b]MCT7988821.1 hypothetical protein [Laspinema sp. D3a]MCT7995922.1 hypothetical protein [Laspinema sp. D3c]